MTMTKPRITYDEGFRIDSVNLLLSSGRPLTSVASKLGVVNGTL